MNIENKSSPKKNQIIRFMGVNLSAWKNVVAALPELFGVGKRNVFDICKATNIDPYVRMFTLSDEQMNAIKAYIEANVIIEGDLRSKIDSDRKRLINIGCYRGFMHKRRLPVRGQRTKTNARTRKGPRKSFGKK